MFSRLLVTLSFFLVEVIAAHEDLSFTYNGFSSANLSLDGVAEFTPNGLLRLTDIDTQRKGHAFYSNPIRISHSERSWNCLRDFSDERTTRSSPNHYLGLFNENNNGNENNHVVAVELDTIKSIDQFDDINNNHVGIDINGLKSEKVYTAGYHNDKNGEFKNLTLVSGKSMKVWVEYDGKKKQMNVTLAPSNIGKPRTPLLSLTRDLSSVVNNTMYVGFSASTGSVPTSHYILGWSFKINGQAQELVLSQLPKLPRMGDKKDRSLILTVGLTLISVIIISLAISGILPTSNIEIAVKRVSQESEQGMREFVSEIVCMRRLRHRNLVPLLGYCRRKGELILVYDYMSNGSLDKYLFDQPKTTLNWSQRLRIIKGVASGLLYLHEEWEQVVIHRDVKASNVLLDSEFNGRLGDFGLSRLYDHGRDPKTTHVVGTLGRPTEIGRPSMEDMILVDHVYSCWKEGAILAASDPNLGSDFVAEEVELVMKLGLMCSQSEPSARPSMRQVVRYLEGIFLCQI
ncbi:hypothetical protein FNV43_RR08449 [Rhamnella rubrinervis]|uniref:non-specific serine/threonine protein kinase n=1 Tax=Rhamnella rubrinervis TaxID=2594499 RepID=A0A8K0H8L5_9ROSA|nr:hypothetical protein FNV43_RR08449 [Rhamnella rubrinervis]